MQIAYSDLKRFYHQDFSKKKIKYQIIKYTNQKFFMLQSINYLQSIMLILLVNMNNKYQKHAACRFFFFEFKNEKI